MTAVVFVELEVGKQRDAAVDYDKDCNRHLYLDHRKIILRMLGYADRMDLMTNFEVND